jgi:hypothetical protein
VSGFGAPKRMASGERSNKEIDQMRALVSGESEDRKIPFQDLAVSLFSRTIGMERQELNIEDRSLIKKQPRG